MSWHWRLLSLSDKCSINTMPALSLTCSHLHKASHKVKPIIFVNMKGFVSLALVLVLYFCVSETDARRNKVKNWPEVTCLNIKADEICDGNNAGFQVFDGCNTCTCDAKKGQTTCTLKMCPRPEDLPEKRMKKKAEKLCVKLERKIKKKLNKFLKKNKKGQENQWPIKCFNEERLCKKKPGVKFFDGCNNCMCPETLPTNGEPVLAGCTRKACPVFTGSRKQFKKHCKSLGAKIERGSRRKNNKQKKWFLF